MATSKVQIGNMALANIADKHTIESFDEASREAKAVKQWYDISREAVLEGMDWNFAKKRLTASSSVTDPPDDWAFRYGYPEDCIVLRKVFNPLGPTADAVPFEVESDPDTGQKSVLTDMDDAILIYTKGVEDVSLFPPSFEMALAAYLAFNIAFQLTGKKSLVDAAAGKYEYLKAIAEGSNSNERVDRPAREAEWIRGR